MTRTPLGTWMSALRRRPAETEAPEPTPIDRGWEPHPDDILEWMGAHPYPPEPVALERSA